MRNEELKTLARLGRQGRIPPVLMERWKTKLGSNLGEAAYPLDDAHEGLKLLFPLVLAVPLLVTVVLIATSAVIVGGIEALMHIVSFQVPGIGFVVLVISSLAGIWVVKTAERRQNAQLRATAFMTSLVRIRTWLVQPEETFGFLGDNRLRQLAKEALDRSVGFVLDTDEKYRTAKTPSVEAARAASEADAALRKMHEQLKRWELVPDTGLNTYFDRVKQHRSQMI